MRTLSPTLSPHCSANQQLSPLPPPPLTHSCAYATPSPGARSFGLAQVLADQQAESAREAARADLAARTDRGPAPTWRELEEREVWSAKQEKQFVQGLREARAHSICVFAAIVSTILSTRRTTPNPFLTTHVRHEPPCIQHTADPGMAECELRDVPRCSHNNRRMALQIASPYVLSSRDRRELVSISRK